MSYDGLWMVGSGLCEINLSTTSFILIFGTEVRQMIFENNYCVSYVYVFYHQGFFLNKAIIT